ncbi:hypothetical protein RBH20_19965 [Haloarcula sp. H-GB4]|nr:hypothetical protein [Haloarcula sp. H-GB4]MDQ2074805.1 hypothetical protein [Haloarcula sp. H-GB4]
MDVVEAGEAVAFAGDGLLEAALYIYIQGVTTSRKASVAAQRLD